MKLSHSAVLGFATLASILAASADTVTVYFSASNGDRNATQVALSRLLRNWSYQGTSGRFPASGTLNPDGNYTGTDNTFRQSNFGTWNGTWNGHTVIVKTNYAGALSGIAAVANQTVQVRFDVTNGQGTTNVPSNLLTISDNTQYTQHVVDFGLSTNFQLTSPFNGDYNGLQYSEIQEIPVGISQLGFYGSPGIPIDNITTQQARQLYDTGSLPLSFFTGNWTNGDQHKWIYALGRNTDAGQRFAAQLEIGRSGLGEQYVYQATDGTNPTEPLAAGGAANAPLVETPAGSGNWQANPSYDASKSYTIGTSVIGGTVSRQRKWPTETWSGITASGGHTSGANLATALTRKLGQDAYRASDPAATAGWYIGYVTPGDADATVLGNGQGAARPADSKGVALKYNGVENTPDNVKSGRYTLWLYNRIVVPKPLDGQGIYSGVAGVTGDPTTTFRGEFVEALANGIRQVVSTQQGISLSDAALKVHRLADGGTVYAGQLPQD
ncbi:hypothetical protein OKA04_21275 [Luteolibacter flavescens]|uniref:Uncharacterized protein n=1 Tax=Luteolibacter flavescens TaxID=1859460 RepID=A0ABT3FUK7_9BACT|nr:hypothetical protein [Luteolibacter flavescens]MCW1887283.1 hypothetical protein [Luteolibacter flavescens]